MDVSERRVEAIVAQNTAKTASSLRNHNERALLSALRAHGPLAGVELAKYLGVSAQTASVLTRVLEGEGFIKRGSPIRGKVGKPLLPVELRADGAFALGLRIGRRGADVILMDLTGKERFRDGIDYQFPSPSDIEDFVVRCVEAAKREIGPENAEHILGMGIASPFELWSWLDALGASDELASQWRDYDLQASLERLTGLKVFVANDVNMACNGEATFGAGRQFENFAYFYVGSFLGGGFVLDHKVFYGSRGNAGAFGSLPYGAFGSSPGQLLHHASIYRLEQRLNAAADYAVDLRGDPQQWIKFPSEVEAWIKETAKALAVGAAAVSAVLDISTVFVDGSFPTEIRKRLVREVKEAITQVDTQGISEIDFLEGQLGRDAGCIGAAYQPLLSGLFLEGSKLSA